MQRPATPEPTVLGTDTAVLRIADRSCRARRTDGGVDALLAWARTPDGASDALVLRALLAVLPRRSPRRVGLVAAIEALEGS